MICSPREPQISTLPNNTMRCCDLMTSLRNAWFGHTAWICPLSSCTSAENNLNPGRRVAARPALSTFPEMAAVIPGRSETIVCMRLRSS